MEGFKIIKTLPGEFDYKSFDELPVSLYPKNSPRFIFGNEPVETHLEGCYVLFSNNKALGRFAFYENKELKYKDETVACIGSYECVSDSVVSTKLLDYAKNLARQRGYKWLIGPMEGSTWNNYRFSNHNNYRNFFLEPFHHIYYNNQFKSSGFEIIAEYFSNLDEELYYDESKLNKFESIFKIGEP